MQGYHRAALLGVIFTVAMSGLGFAEAQQIDAARITYDESSSPIDTGDWNYAATQRLTQRAPKPGEATPYLTQARVLVSRSHVYVRVDCDDPHPDKAVAHATVFDADQSYDDHVVLILDTFSRHRTAYEFDVNVRGVRTDGLISPAAILTSYDWNGNWRADVVATPTGWTAYIAIDTRSIQFDRNADAWGMNLARYVPREQLSLQWSGISLDASITDLSRAGLLRGMQNLESSAGWTLAPYALTRYSNVGRGAAQTGFDLRYNISPEMTAIATVNPDFAEAEVDAQQINLTPYTLFKPEKRAFFLEGANQFTFASGIGSIFLPFYSRTIGLIDGYPVRIDEGMKVVGQSGPWSIGALGVHTGNSVVGDPANLFVGRATYDINEHLRVGTLMTDGDPTGRTRNHFEGIDGVWRTATLFGDKNLNVSAWAARSGGDTLAGDHRGFGTYIDFPNDLWRAVLSANQFGDALDPALGFLPRPGTRQYDVYFGHFPRPTSERWNWVRQFFYETELEQTDDLHGSTQSRKITLTPFNVITESAQHFEMHASSDYERLTQPFPIASGVTLPSGEYRFDRIHAQAESSTADALQIGAQVEAGGFYGGTLIQATPYVRWTSRDGRWHFEFDSETDRARVPEGRFTQRLHQFKASYAFDNELAFSSFTQFDSSTNRIGVNAQVRWIVQPGREVFVIFNHDVAPSLADPASRFTPVGNSLTVKLQWALYR